jgi:hypothetical protein
MKNLALKVPVVESEAGWGRKIDDWMVCQSMEDAKLFEEEFNSVNEDGPAPDWYMQVEGEPVEISLSDKQMECLKENNRIWWSELKRIT